MRIAQDTTHRMIAFTMAGLVIAVAAWAAIPNMYSSTAVAAVPPAATNEIVSDAAQQVLSLRSIREIIAMHRLGSTDPDEVEEFKKHLRISKVESSGFSIAFESRDPAKSQAVVQEVTDRLVKLMPGGATVIEAASLSKSPVSPALLPILIVGTIGGLMLGGAVGLFRRSRKSPVVACHVVDGREALDALARDLPRLLNHPRQ